MMTLKQVLVPTDFSETSEQALGYARALADAFKATLHLLHVVPDPYSQSWSMVVAGVAIPELLKTWEQDAHTRLDELKLASRIRL